MSVLSGDLELSCQDGISSLKFSSKANHLISTTWDGKTSCWSIDIAKKSASGLVQLVEKSPVLCSSWSESGDKVFLGTCESKAKIWDLNANQSLEVAQHRAPIKDCFWIPEMTLLVTASWDNAIKFWDLRAPTPVTSIDVPKKYCAMDVSFPLAVVASADKQVTRYDLQQRREVEKIKSPLHNQPRVITCLPSKDGFAIGGIEARTGIHCFNDTRSTFAFRCHREVITPSNAKSSITDLYAINSIVFHPTIIGKFATAGADGRFCFWDQTTKKRMKAFPQLSAPVSCAAFNNTGDIYVYASSYDWSKGSEHYNPATAKNSIGVHWVSVDELNGKI